MQPKIPQWLSGHTMYREMCLKTTLIHGGQNNNNNNNNCDTIVLDALLFFFISVASLLT